LISVPPGRSDTTISNFIRRPSAANPRSIVRPEGDGYGMNYDNKYC
jgi:hypothetical protein